MRHLITIIVAAQLGCGGGTAPGMAPAEAAFWDGFHGQAYASLPSLRAQLQMAYDADPGDPENTLLLAHANLWTIAELGRDPNPDTSQIPARASDALRYFGEAAKLAPDDRRIDGWLGTMSFAIGNFTMNPTLVQAGRQQIDAGVAAYPEFNLFVRALVNGQLPANTPEFASALDDLWKTLDRCAGEPVDRANPDFTRYLGRATTDGPERVCWNDDRAPHNFEGFFEYMGDLMVKSGDPDGANRIYANAQRIDSYGAWPFRADLEQRIATAGPRAALYADADPSNDPPLAPQTATGCANCHATH